MAFSGCATEPPQTTVPPTTTAPTAPPGTPPATSIPATVAPQIKEPTSALADSYWLNAHLNDKNLRILYIGSGAAKKSSYDVGHIPGSVYLTIFKLFKDESQADIGSRGIVASKETFEQVAGELGITDDMIVVVYGIAFDPYVARAFWTFKYYGHDKVYYLDGGIDDWTSKFPTSLSIDTPDTTPTTYKAKDGDAGLIASADYIADNLANKNVLILDVRASDEYFGKNVMSGVVRGGHIPGSVNLEFRATNLNNNGTFRSPSDLKSRYEAAGVTKDKEVIVLCQTGVRASQTFMVLKYILDYPNVKNYDGSWDEWNFEKDVTRFPVVI